MSSEQRVSVAVKLTHDKLNHITSTYLTPYWSIIDVLTKNGVSNFGHVRGAIIKGYIHEGVRAYEIGVTQDYAALINNRLSVEGKFIDTRIWRGSVFYDDIAAVIGNYSATVNLLRKTHTFYKKAYIIHKKILRKTIELGLHPKLYKIDAKNTNGMEVWIPEDMSIDKAPIVKIWASMQLTNDPDRLDEQFFTDHLPELLTNYQRFMAQYVNFYNDNIKPYKLLALIS